MNEAMEVSTFTDNNRAGVSTLAEMQNAQTPPADQQAAQNVEGTPQGQPQQTAADPNVNTTPPADQQTQTPPAPDIPAPQTQEAAQNTLKTVGLDLTKYETEYLANGELSQESYNELINAGIPKSMVDGYITGQEAVAQRIMDEVHAIAGGTDGFHAMSQWAARNVPYDELVAFNHIMAGGKKELITLAVTGMVSKWKSAVGSQPKLTQGRVSAPSRVQGFASSAEMVKAMQDKRYGKDPAYTRSVEDRVARSNIFG